MPLILPTKGVTTSKWQGQYWGHTLPPLPAVEASLSGGYEAASPTSVCVGWGGEVNPRDGIRWRGISWSLAHGGQET